MGRAGYQADRFGEWDERQRLAVEKKSSLMSTEGIFSGFCKRSFPRALQIGENAIGGLEKTPWDFLQTCDPAVRHEMRGSLILHRLAGRTNTICSVINASKKRPLIIAIKSFSHALVKASSPCPFQLIAAPKPPVLKRGFSSFSIRKPSMPFTKVPYLVNYGYRYLT